MALEAGQFFICDLALNRKERALNPNQPTTNIDLSAYENHGIVYEPSLSQVQRCEFYLNDRLINIEVLKPYAVLGDQNGQLTRLSFPNGEHKLSVLALGRQNQRESSTVFFRIQRPAAQPRPEAENTQALYLCDADLNQKVEKAHTDLPLYWGEVNNPTFVYEPCFVNAVRCDFFINERLIQTEWQAPFALGRDRDGDLRSAKALLEQYESQTITLKVVAYAQAGQTETCSVQIARTRQTEVIQFNCAPMQGMTMHGVQFNPLPSSSLQIRGKLQFVYDDGRIETLVSS